MARVWYLNLILVMSSNEDNYAMGYGKTHLSVAYLGPVDSHNHHQRALEGCYVPSSVSQ